MASIVSPASGYQYFGCNNVPVEFNGSSGEVFGMKVVNASTAAYVILTAETYNGKIRFDLAPIARRWFGNSLSDASAYFVEVNFSVNSSMSSFRIAFLHRAAAQLGNSTNWSSTSRLLTSFSKCKRWIFGHMTTNNHKFVRNTGTSAGVELVTSFGTQIVDVCTPERPVLLRWLNLQGGCDYWCFSKPTIEASLMSCSESDIILTNAQITSGNPNRIPYDAELVSYVTVGSGALNENEMDVVSKIIYSPVVEYWDDTLQKWLRVTIKPGSIKYNGTAGYGNAPANQNIELTFQMPNIYNQF